MSDVSGNPEQDSMQRAPFLVLRKPVGSTAISAHGNVDADYLKSRRLQSDTSNNSPRKPRQFGSRILHNWWIEMLSCILVIAVTIALVATIHPHQDLPLSRWPYSISVNSLVAILVVIMKAAMLLVTAEGLSELKWAWFKTHRPLSDLAKYDMASRGPWGSLRLLWTLRGRDSIASIGAFVTIAALAIDPFAQQLVRYYNCRVADLTLSATVPRTSLYDETGRDEGSGVYTLDPGVQAAINNGIYNTGGIIPFNCPSGNCTFDTPYHSIGYCTSCSDISNRLTIHVTNFTSTSEPFITTVVNTTLPSGLSTTWGLEDGNGTYFVMGPSESFLTTYEMIFGIGAGNKTPWDEQESFLFTPEQLEACSDPATSDIWYCKGFGAAECSILPCIKTYSGTVSDGTLTERLENIPWVFSSYSSSHAATVVDVDCLSPHQKQYVQSRGYQIRNDTHWIW